MHIKQLSKQTQQEHLTNTRTHKVACIKHITVSTIYKSCMWALYILYFENTIYTYVVLLNSFYTLCTYCILKTLYICCIVKLFLYTLYILYFENTFYILCTNIITKTLFIHYVHVLLKLFFYTLCTYCIVKHFFLHSVQTVFLKHFSYITRLTF